MTAIRPAAVAGAFYPADATTLSDMVSRFIDDAGTAAKPVPKAIIAPHAGYVYSGAVAGTAYAPIRQARETITRVVLLSPCHRVAVRGLALSGMDAFRTPLGDVPVDKDACAKILDLPQVSVFEPTHEKEHGLEVHLPFLQDVLETFSLVPLVVGETSSEQVAAVLERLWGGDETLIVISSDLSHYLDYDAARAIDARTCKAIEDLAPERFEPNSACGRFPLAGLLNVAKQRGMAVDTLEVKNSGDTAGGKDRVVGYGSWLLHETDAKPAEVDTDAAESNSGTPGGDFEARTHALLRRHGGRLLKMAATSIRFGLKEGKAGQANLANMPEDLKATGATFVTLKTGEGQLRGCIGSVQAHRPLASDIVENAFKAAFKDPRFKPLSPPELDGLRLSISVLSPQAPMEIADEADLLRQLRPGIDGLVIADAGKRALFLPAVWQQLPEPPVFLEHLKRKARMAPDHWSDAFQAHRFIAAEISSAALADPASLWAG